MTKKLEIVKYIVMDGNIPVGLTMAKSESHAIRKFKIAASRVLAKEEMTEITAFPFDEITDLDDNDDCEMVSVNNVR
jgi:hypothetical protein